MWPENLANELALETAQSRALTALRSFASPAANSVPLGLEYLYKVRLNVLRFASFCKRSYTGHAAQGSGKWLGDSAYFQCSIFNTLLT